MFPNAPLAQLCLALAHQKISKKPRTAGITPRGALYDDVEDE